MKLSYSACAMRAIESWSLSLCSIAAGWLPDPAQSLAAMAVAFSVYGTLNMVFGRWVDGCVGARWCVLVQAGVHTSPVHELGTARSHLLTCTSPLYPSPFRVAA